MSQTPIELHPRAISESRAAQRRYARISLALAERFMEELDRAISLITTRPKAWPPYLRGTRAFRLRRFPYLVVYLDLPDKLLVVAVAHGHRRPGYWRRRLR